jgi:hypothetical protein
MQSNDEQPGDREAEGAIAGMLEVYGAPAEPVTEGIPMDLLVLDPSELEESTTGIDNSSPMACWKGLETLWKCIDLASISASSPRTAKALETWKDLAIASGERQAKRLIKAHAESKWGP